MVKNNILIIGTIGRDHAVGWKLKQSKKVGKIYFAPGNAGTEEIGESTGIDALDIKSLIKFANDKKIDLSITSSDDALASGVVNEFNKNGLTIFGPTREAAQLEWSKAFAKKLMDEENIPTATYKTFDKSTDAKKYLKSQSFPIVVKASGLALGKGVIIAENLKDAEAAIDEIMIKKAFGKAGSEVVIEEFLKGQEVSIHVFSDGTNVSLFPTSRDHKRIGEGNTGPNTGGMGTISPLTKISKKDIENIKKTIVMPVINGMKKRGIPFKGCLYPGIMMTNQGPKVLEFNCRFGDPEMQSYMRLLKSDLFDILLACAKGDLSKVKIEWSKDFACTIILASTGYPGDYKKGEVIKGLDKVKKNKDVIVFHQGTKKQEGKILTNGGRVLAVTATAKTLKQALKKAYSVIGKNGINFVGMQYRKDIGSYGT